MNPQLHDEFVAFMALFFAGELGDEEWALLQVHLAYCDSCRQKFEQYEQITSNVIPMMAGGAASESAHAPEESAASFEAAERRLMDRLKPALSERKTTSTQSVVPWRVLSAVLAACAIGMAGLIGVHHLHPPKMSGESSDPVAPLSAPVPSSTAALSDSQLQRELATSREEIATLEREAKAAEDRYGQSKLAATDAEQQLQVERAERDKANAEREALSQKLAEVQTEAQSLRDKSAAGASEAAQQATRVEALENKVHLLNASLIEKESALGEKERDLALDKDFLAHDRDIRDVIGARNLYIADIFDTGTNGKTAKPFGRIFYTKDRSLVFYGFDLDKQAGVAQSAAFQVWGSGSDKQTVNLGLFYQDDDHKRWVLRCDDAKALARLNMVFVTVEPPGGSSKPTGKQLLRAYLQIDANHP